MLIPVTSMSSIWTQEDHCVAKTIDEEATNVKDSRNIFNMPFVRSFMVAEMR